MIKDVPMGLVVIETNDSLGRGIIYMTINATHATG